MSIKWIVADVDGCISPEESAPWDLEAFGRFARLVREAAAGRGTLAPLTLCTGRPQPYAEALMKVLDVRAPAICENGAVLYSLHDNRARFGPGVTEEKILALRAVRGFIETELLPAHPDALLQFGKEAQISVFSETGEAFADVTARVEAFAAANGGPELVINRTPFYLNISLAGVDKGSTLRALFSELGVGREDVAGIGDSEGDLPLREAVGFFACPANARSCLKAVADYVSPYEDIEGMLDILQRPEVQRG
ncbi:MAG: HAD hydrolase family protein [Candidatus Hydrogenedentes bacterium]|nr:HAD hydrolase family protein [Candidatus Hydrogenedentota bacterium]